MHEEGSNIGEDVALCLTHFILEHIVCLDYDHDEGNQEPYEKMCYWQFACTKFRRTV